MATAPTTTTAPDRALLEAARGGDESAFARVVEPRQRELQAHCYRMLGSVHDAEDALQEAMIRAWKRLDSLEDPKALRAWLYKIATNTCLDAIAKRPKRVVPVDYAGPADPHAGPGEPVVEQIWIEPLADETLSIEDGLAGPEARYEQREAVELSFIAALQLLPANQRAALVLREVLGFSAKEAAETLDTSTASINSALQRARATVEDKLPEQSQQQTLRQLGDEKLKQLVDRYVKAWEENDVDTVVGMLTEDAAFTMPPLASWFSGQEEIEIFLRLSPMGGDWRWKAVRTQANGQPALAFYTFSPEKGYYEPFALNILTFEGERISEVDAFMARTPPDPDPETILRMPEHEYDERALAAAFGRFDLPDRLEA